MEIAGVCWQLQYHPSITLSYHEHSWTWFCGTVWYHQVQELRMVRAQNPNCFGSTVCICIPFRYAIIGWYQQQGNMSWNHTVQWGHDVRITEFCSPNGVVEMRLTKKVNLWFLWYLEIRLAPSKFTSTMMMMMMIFNKRLWKDLKSDLPGLGDLDFLCG